MRLNVRWKIALSIMLAVFLTGSAMGFYSVRTTSNELRKTVEEKLVSENRLALKYIDEIIPGSWSVKDGELYKGSVSIKDQVKLVDELQELTGNSVTIFQREKRLVTTLVDDQGKRQNGTEASELVQEKVLGEGESYLGQADVLGEVYNTIYSPLHDSSGRTVGMFYMGASHEVYDAVIDTITRELFLTMLFGQILANLIAWLVAKHFSSPITQIKGAMQKAENGDLTAFAKVTNRDELGILANSFNSMMEKVSKTIKQVGVTADGLAASAQQLLAGAEESSRATEQIATTINQVADGTDSQAKSIERAADVVGGLSSTSQEIAQNSQKVLQETEVAFSASEHGRVAISDTIEQMTKINSSVKEFSGQIATLGDRSQEIGKIVEVITSIAKQTNLLALNAAIEAARAGEHGRGFAVVADEVRKLAEQSGEAATQISGLILEIQEETSKAVQAMEARTDEAANGMVVVNRAGEAFQEIAQAVARVKGMMVEVSKATDEMAQGGRRIVEAIESIAAVSEQTAASAQQVTVAAEEQTASVEEVAASSSLLSQMADDLLREASSFKLKD